MEIFRAAKKFSFGSQRKLNDIDFFSDRLSHRHTTKIIIVFVILATFKRFYSSPVNCWVPAELKRYEKYINRYCWIRGTYYVEQHYDLNTFNIEAREENLLQYYQWIYFFLLVQAFLFYLPKMLWCFMSSKILDYDLFNMIDAASKHDTYSSDQEKILKYLSSNLLCDYNWLPAEKREIANQVKQLINDLHLKENKNKRRFSFTPSLLIKKFSRSFLTLTYITTKLIYLLNAIGQIVLMDMFLSNENNLLYGKQIVQTILNGDGDLVNHTDSRIFPRITICDVKTKEIGGDHLYTVQCVLSFNLFNERIYAFLWLWIFLIVVPFTFIDLLVWLKRLFLFSEHYRYNFIKTRINIFDRIKTSREKILVKLFTEYYIGNDGVFVLRLIEHNTNAVVVAELVDKMWHQFRNEQNQ